ncbi:CPBP family intramembrane glutamic endopeptidase [Nocardia pneumoniae]|uniref:CPBP family intramembrane glutamic endopeptidase n=1 Tax=Nocardia pneumoniae TaxID=228601 RepID=UPI00030CC254|nr:CPBP family intramembrane glutamic endopeptidase [Nocardia pneumoniae]
MALPLAWSNLVLPRLGLGVRGRTAANAGFATGYALALRDRTNWYSPGGLRYGLLAASAVAASYCAALALPAARRRVGAIGDRRPEVSTVEWVAVHIPIGTVYTEELIFRGTLDPIVDNAFGPRAGAVLSAATFGLWHITPARVAGDSVPATIAVTTAGGLVFSGLRRRTADALAPALLHLAMNVGGAITPRLARHLGASFGER